MTRLVQLLYLLLAVSPIVFSPFAHWAAMGPQGTDYFLWVEIYFYVLLLLVALIAIPICLGKILVSRDRRHAVFILLLSLLFVPCCILGFRLGQRVRMQGIKDFATRSHFLIAAIQEYERDHQSPPSSLGDLVPNYLDAVPTTGMSAYPEYRYHTGEEAKQEYDDNPWALSVFTPSGGINFDMMLYFPKQNYPIHGFGGSLERIGEWAYVHE